MRFATIMSAFALLATQQFVFADNIYNVVPLNLGNGYHVAGGTVSVDTSLTNITAWNIQVTGEFPYTFSDSNLDAFVDDAAFRVTPSEITFSVTDSIATSARFGDRDNSSAFCDDCMQNLIWTQLGPTRDSLLVYGHLDEIDNSPRLTEEILFPDGDVVVATAVPESTAATFSLFASVSVVVLRRRTQ